MNGTNSSYGLRATLDVPFAEALTRVRDALQAEGFGVLTEIDMQGTMRATLGVEMAPYRILGACNPSLAHRALTADPQIGLMLPCNVVVRAEGEKTRVDIADPEAMLGIGGTSNTELRGVATEARQRLQRVLAALVTGRNRSLLT